MAYTKGTASLLAKRTESSSPASIQALRGKSMISSGPRLPDYVALYMASPPRTSVQKARAPLSRSHVLLAPSRSIDKQASTPNSSSLSYGAQTSALW